MRLTIKIVIWLLIANMTMLAIDGFLSVRERVEFVNEDMQSDTRLLGEVAQALLTDVWRAGGELRAQQLIRDANAAEHLIQIRWVLPTENPPAEYRPAAALSEIEQVNNGRSVTIRKTDKYGASYAYSYFPIVLDPSHRAALELAECLTPAEAFARAASWRTIGISIVLILVSALATGIIGVRFVGRPLHILKDKARRVGRGDLSGPVVLPGHNELANLASAMNRMCEELTENRERLQRETEGRLQALEALRHADRLKTVGRLAAGVAHEVGTPLNVISGRAAMLTLEGTNADEVRENALIIKSQTDRITALVRQLLGFARRRAPQRTATSVADVTRQTVQLLAPQAKKKSIELAVTLGDAPYISSIDPSQIQQVLMNIIMNAIQATPEPGRIEIEVDRTRAEPPPGTEATSGDYVVVSVEDHGTGIPEENMRHLFEPFFTTKQVGEGAGLGLPIAYGIVQEHGGWIDVRSEEGRGSRFSVYLPHDSTGACA